MQPDMYWRPVWATLPMPLEDVLVVNSGQAGDKPDIDMAYLRTNAEWVLTGSDPLIVIKPSHWMPLPLLPTDSGPEQEE